MIIRVDDLQKIADTLFSKLKKNVGLEIDISKDYYWNISDDELYNPYQEPKTLTIGQLSDDITELQRLLEKDETISYDIKRFAEVLKAISLDFVF
ncbi:MAG: hypothetical protein WC142_04010 [Bacteroidales bacterium]|jgi:hypothetical protein|nr:hypothetical protein [Bacteroidales bacterium]HBC30007.1 hypothetical protein [Clostridiales bacterium]